MKISIVAAQSTNRVIGRNKELPWHLPADLRFFEETIKGGYLITGRKSYESAQGAAVFTGEQPFIVVSRQPDYHASHGKVAHSLKAAIRIATAASAQQLYILGGANIYQQAMPLADVLIITLVHATIEGDTFFPVIDPQLWEIYKRQDFEMDEEHEYAYSFIHYKRIA